MQSATATRLYGGALDAAATSVFTASVTTEIVNVSFVPRAEATVILYIVPKGETRSTAHEYYRNEIKANETAGLTFMAEGSGPTLKEGDQVHAAHSAANGSVTLTIYGITAKFYNAQN